MPHFLSDPSPTTYLLLVAAAVVTGVVAARWQDRKRVAPFAVALLLLGALYLIDRLYASPREDAVTLVGSMFDAVNAGHADRFLGAVSEAFDYRGMKKNDLKRALDLARQHNVKVTAWNFDRNKVVYHDTTPPTVEIVFDAKADGPTGQPVPKHVRMTFVRDPDGAYRMRSFATYNIVRKAEEEPVPGLGK
jgi:hypothetical protein